MGQGFLLDSNVIIDYTSGLLPTSAAKSLDSIIDDDFIISIIVKIEVLGFNGPEAAMKNLHDFLELATVVHLDNLVAAEVIELRKHHKRLGLGDAIIAATSRVHGLSLITRNTDDFKRIKNITLVNPYDL